MNTEPAPLLSAHGISKAYPGVVALDNVSMHLAEGEVLAIIGENGAGKSTLMKVLSGAVAPDEGRMWIDGAPYAPRSPREAQQALLEAGDEEAMMPDWDYVEAMEYGFPPTFGFGFGERLFATFEDKPIRETQLFPLMRPKKN